MAKKRKPFSSDPLGSGGRFQACVRAMEKRGVDDPRAACAAIGRRAYGKERFQELAAAGRRRAARAKRS